MSNYISMLSEAETNFLCQTIGGKEFKGLFKQNSKEFSKIRPGFRASSLSPEKAILTALRNISKPFISNFVNSEVESWLKQINDHMAKLESEGIGHEDALAQTLVDSYFNSQIELYFKLINQPIERGMIDRITLKMHEVQEKKKKDKESEIRIAELETSVADLTEQLSQAREAAESMRADYDAEISGYKKQIESLMSTTEETQKQLDVLRSTPSSAQAESNDDQWLQEFDDRMPDVLPSMSDENYFSLCKVTVDYSGRTWLIRLADINYRGNLDAFQKDSERPSYFENRDRLYYKDGPSEQDFMGVWKWSTVPNVKDSNKDYVTTEFYNEIQPIEVIIVPDCTSTKDLSTLLQNGISAEVMNSRILFAYSEGKGKYVGILCDNHSMHMGKGKVTISKDVIELPVYEFSTQDMIRLEDNLLFLRSVFAGIPNRRLQIKSPMEIVKNAILDSVSWPAYKQRGFIRAQYSNIREFIKELPVNEISDRICNACHCNKAEAEHLLRRFLDSLNEYFDGNSFDDDIICAAILGNELLMQRAKELITQDWETENKALLNKKADLQSELKRMDEALSHARQEFDEIAAKEKALSDSIDSKESLASEVEEQVAARIRQAQEHVAEFIANMAFVGGRIPEQVNEPDYSCFEPSHAQRNTYMVVPSAENPADREANDDWEAAVETVKMELQEAGVSEAYARGFAAFLCAAYINKQPVVLVGPNARDIIAAFSAALTAGKHGVLFCEGEYSNEAIARIGSDGESIVEIVNLFGSGWISRLPEILSHKDTFYMASHPFSEDMQVEPKSLYNFMLPVFTEFIVNKKASGEYRGGYFSDQFSPYKPHKNSDKNIKALAGLNMNALVRNQLRSMLSTMHGIYSEATKDDDFLLAYFPYFYATMTLESLMDAIESGQQEITITTNLRREMKCILGET